MEQVIEFLEKNGLLRTHGTNFANNKCSVFIDKNHYVILSIDGKSKMYSVNLSIYWLIGVLTYYGYMDKNYKQ